jgi:predicted nucleotide-binding protein
MNETQLKLLQNLKTQVSELPHRNSGKLDALKQRTEMLINKIFGNSSNYHATLKKILFNPRMVIGGSGSGPYDSAWKSGHNAFHNLVDTMIEDVSLEIGETTQIKKPDFAIKTDEVFIVHGHNKEMKESTARTIEKLGLKPIILHEQANKGRTIIQKFIDHSSVGFAIVLVSADDFGYSKKEQPEKAKLRARQNVILELGFFLGKLGIDRVVALFEQKENFEIPTDYDGVIFIPFDDDGRWKFDLIRELKALNYEVDANSIL